MDALGTEGTPPMARQRGRPLSKDTERAILDATAFLLAEQCLADISLEDIAARARVSKASIYRRWPSKGTLAFESFMGQFMAEQPLPDLGRLEDDLTAALRNWAHTVVGTPAGRTLKGLIAEVQRDPELAEAWRDRFVVPVRRRHLLMTDRAVERGELYPEADAKLLIDFLFGPAYHRLLHGHLPIDDAFVSAVVKAIMAAVAAGAF